MDWRWVLTAFGTIFLAELGDKTQLAALTMTGSSGKPWSVFVGAALALVVVTALGVAAGAFISRWVPENVLRRVAAAAFVVIGVVMFFKD